MSNKVKALLAVLAIVVFSGGTSPYIKLALETIPPMTFTFIRFFASFLIILPLFIYRAKPKFNKISRKLIYLSLLQTANIFLFAYGIRLTLASVGQIIYSFTPILVSLMSFYSLKEKIGLKKIIGVILGFIGVNLIVMIPFFTNKTSGNASNAFLGNLLIFVGCISYSYYSVLSKKFLKTYSPMWLTIFFVFTTSLVSLFFALFEPSFIKVLTSIMASAVLWPVAYVILIGTVMAYLLQQYAIDRGSPLIYSLMQYLFPASTLIWSYFILREQLNIFLAIGITLILTGAWLVTRES